MQRQASLAKLAITTAAVTASGALSPGPLSAATIAVGLLYGGWKAGILVAVGHTLIELPYVAAIWLALEKARRVIEKAKKPLVTVTAAFILYFAWLLAEAAAQGAKVEAAKASLGPLTALGPTLTPIVVGAILTGANAYFLLWWLTVGFPLIEESAAHGPHALAVMYASHVWMDYAWLAFLAEAGAAAGTIGGAWYQALLVALATILIIFAADMLAREYLNKPILPY